MEEYNISAAVVVYNNPEDAHKTVGSILENTKGQNFSLFVVDNASKDEIGKSLKTAFPQPCYIMLPHNVGFGKGNNMVLDKLHSKYHFIINPDILINADTIKNMCSFMDENPEVAICCPKVLHPDGTVQYLAKRRPTLLALLSRRVHFGAFKKIESQYLAAQKSQDDSFEIEFCTGCFFVIRTEIFKKIGGFDPQYFLYFEDADITMEAKRYGKAFYNPNATVVHFWHRATAQSFKPFMQQLKSMFIYFKKWGFKL
ncbi:MAG: glycosyltransferase family 2 protein [Oscillospiraceae bacterium]